MNNHLPISKEMEAVMKKHLSAKFANAESERYWKKVLTQYEECRMGNSIHLFMGKGVLCA